MWAILFHVGLGVLASKFRPLMLAYVPLVLLYFGWQIVQTKNKTVAVLAAAAYIAGAEVFFRMTKGYLFYETGKYAVILLMLVGMFYRGFQKKSYPYLLYFVLLIPGILVTINVIGLEEKFRQTILFNLSGPMALIAGALFCYGRKIRFKDLLKILDYMVYPIIAMTIYVFLYTPGGDIADIATSAASNPALSGGYGPNQVSTVLGLGVFILYTRFLIPYKNKWIHLLMMFFLVAMAYRALLTFSRGGVLVAILMAAAFTFFVYTRTGIKTKTKVTLKLLGTLGITIGIWFFTLLQTGGMLGYRYENKDSIGREKESITTGRLELLLAEYQAFLDHPMVGVGVGKVDDYHREILGVDLPTHNEISRMFSEHGIFGIVALLILIGSPLLTKLQGRKNIYFFPLFIFWFLTVSHSSMRIALPGYMYGLSLLSLHYGKKTKKKPPHENSLSGQPVG